MLFEGDHPNYGSLAVNIGSFPAARQSPPLQPCQEALFADQCPFVATWRINGPAYTDIHWNRGPRCCCPGYRARWRSSGHSRVSLQLEPARQLLRQRGSGVFLQQPEKKRIHANRAVATANIAKYIETFHNPTRRYSHLDGISPEEFVSGACHGCRNGRLVVRVSAAVSAVLSDCRVRWQHAPVG